RERQRDDERVPRVRRDVAERGEPREQDEQRGEGVSATEEEPSARPDGRSRRCIDEAGRDVEPRARGSEGGLERRGEVEKERPRMVPSEPRVRPEQRVAAPDVAR